MIIRNIIKTPDGTLLESKHQHDYVTHLDANGELYSNDGGKTYLRRSVNDTPYIDLSVHSTDDISIIREHLLWGTYGKDGKSPLAYITLKSMSNAHVEAILADSRYSSNIIDLFNRELEYRKLNNIYIKD